MGVLIGVVVFMAPEVSGRLIGHWKFDEVSGNEAFDSSGLNHGEWVPGIDGQPDWRPSGGLLEGGIEFPGRGNHQNYFAVAGFEELNGNTRGMSVSVWLKPTRASGYRGIFMTREVTDNAQGGATGQNYGLGHEADHVDGRVSQAGFDTLDGSLPVSPEWLHVVWVWNNEEGNQRVYLNGVQSGPTHTSSSFPANTSIISNGEWRIGDDACCNDRNFSGFMDDLSVWDEALPISEVNRLYQNGLSGFAADEQAPPPPTDPLNVGVVINEIHYDPEPKTRLVEFVEILNTDDTEVAVGGWRFDDGIDFTFPDGTVIPPTGYVLLAENPGALLESFPGIPPETQIFEFSGSLSNEGESISLRTNLGQQVDAVSYRAEFPWPISPNGEGGSMQLVNGAVDNDLGGAWRGGVPSPGIGNGSFLENAPPLIRQVGHEPKMPGSSEAVTIRAKITDVDEVVRADLLYQVVEPGNYIPARLPLSSSTLRGSPETLQPLNPDFEDPARWQSLPMNHVGDSIYEVILPAHPHRTLVRYRIVAEDTNSAVVRIPYPDDPSLNFAYFCYDGVPSYTADLDSVHPDGAGRVYGEDIMGSLPLFHLVTDADHLEQCWAYDASDRVGSVASRKAFNWEGTMIYDGEVYDHVKYRLRQKNDRYAGQGRRSMRFRFQRGNYLEARDPDGNRYPNKWRSMNTSKMSRFVEQANHGMRELVSSRLWNLAGVTAPEFQHVHFRVIDSAAEAPDQYRGDFYGMAMIFEDVDGQFLKNRELPRGNVYKLKDGASNPLELQKHQAREAVTDASDFINIRDHLGPPTQSDEWLREHVDWESYYLYAALGEGFRHYDFSPAFQKNRIWYFRPDAMNPLGKMSVIPHDTDATWKRGTNDSQWDDPRYSGGTTPGGVSYRGRVVGIDLPKEAIQEIAGLDGTDGENHPEREGFMLEYRNTIREVSDLFWRPETVNAVVDDAYDRIAEFSLADRDRWDKGPAEVGFENIGPLEAQVDLIKSLAFTEDLYRGVSTAGGRRSRLMDLAVDPDIPVTPTLSYVGPEGFPAGRLRFRSASFADPGGDESFSAMEWRVAGVSDEMEPFESRVFEWHADWESGVLTNFTPEVSVPAEATRVGETYRARVRHQDLSGRWSHWSDPVEFTVGEPDVAPYLDALVVSEIMFLPAPPSVAEAAAGFVEANDFEFIELRNVGSQVVSLEGIRFTKGIDFDFSGSAVTSLAPGGFVLVVEDLDAFAFRYGEGYPVAGQWSGGLNREGERIKLSYGAGEAVRDFVFEATAPWPVSTPGESLALVHAASLPDHGNALSWRSSEALSGSPGTSDGLLFAESGDEAFLNYITGGSLPVVSQRGGVVSFSIELNRRADDLDGRLMVSTDLQSWLPAGQFEVSGVAPTEGDFAVVTFTGIPPANEGTTYFRFEMTRRQLD